MPIISEVQERLRLAYPESADVLLARAVQEGAYLADHSFEGESFFNNQIGRDIRGHIRRVGISYQIDRYCTRGDLPFVAAMKPMPHGNWHWLEILATGSVAHVCRTDDVFKFPQEADSRQDVRLALQPDLLTWMDKDKSLGEIIKDIPKLYAWLAFRVGQDGRLGHLCWASPAADTDSWIAHINVLEEIAKRGADLPAASAVADPREKLKLKDHIAEALKKSADKKPSA